MCGLFVLCIVLISSCGLYICGTDFVDNLLVLSFGLRIWHSFGGARLCVAAAMSLVVYVSLTEFAFGAMACG